MCALFGLVSLAIYDTLGEQGVGHILEQTEVKNIFCNGESLSKLINGDNKQVNTIICFDPFTEEQV